METTAYTPGTRVIYMGTSGFRLDEGTVVSTLVGADDSVQVTVKLDDGRTVRTPDSHVALI